MKSLTRDSVAAHWLADVLRRIRPRVPTPEATDPGDLRRLDGLSSFLVASGLQPLEPGPTGALLRVSRANYSNHWKGVWDALKLRLTELPGTQLGPAKRTAWLLLTYDASVRSGGHAAYFARYGLGCASEAEAALREVGVEEEAHLLHEAIRRDFAWAAESGFCAPQVRRQPEAERPPRYDDLDSACRALGPELDARLERFVRANVADFLEIRA